MIRKFRYVLLEILAIVLFLISMLPFILVLMNSAKSPSIMITRYPLGLPTEPMNLFSNIYEVLTSPNVRYFTSFMSSTIITIVSVSILILIASMAAWVLVRTKTRLSSFIFFMFIAAMVIPFQVVMFPLISWFFSIEVALGLSGPIRLLQNYPGIILAYMGFGSSLSIFLYHGFIKGIPYELEEAATIDGCSKPRVFFNIIFPLLKPVTITVMILNGIWIWNDFLLPLLILGSGNPIQTLPVAVAAFVGSFVRRWDLILTSTLMAMLPIVIVFLFVQKHIIKGMVDGSIK